MRLDFWALNIRLKGFATDAKNNEKHARGRTCGHKKCNSQVAVLGEFLLYFKNFNTS